MSRLTKIPMVVFVLLFAMTGLTGFGQAESVHKDSKRGMSKKFYARHPHLIHLKNVQCDPGLVVTGFDENGLPICDCPFGIVPDFVDEDEFWSVSNVSIDGGSNTAIVAPGSTFTVSLDYTHSVIPGCSGCIIQFQLGFSHLEPEDCLLQRGFAPLDSSGSTDFTAPTQPGIYYIEVRRTLELFCLDTWENTQGSGVDWPRYRVVAICVK